MKRSNTRSRLVVTIAALVLKQYPVKWKAAELAVATGAHVRSVERALREMADGGLLEKRASSYTLSSALIKEIYGAQWYVRKTIDKDLLLQSIKRKDGGAGQSSPKPTKSREEERA